MKAVIIDDEHYACQALVTLLKRHCPQVEVVAVCNDAREAANTVRSLQPQLVFLDIEMPYYNGFEVLEQLKSIQFDCIFTTSYDQYAIRAIRFSALDYLLKPVDPEELKAAVQKAEQHKHSLLQQQMELLLQRFQQPQPVINRIALPSVDGLQIIPVDTILHCSSSSNYTILALKENQKLVVARTLKEIEEMLEEYHFLRVHHSWLVNLNEVKKYTKGEGGSLLMTDGTVVDVSRSRKETLLKKLLPGK